MPLSPSLTHHALHAQIAERLRRDLATQFRPGDRFPSQNELGRRFKVSPPTAREAVAQLVQEGLLERRFGSGTYVTAHKPERWVAVLSELDLTHPTTSYYFRRVAQALRERFAASGMPARTYFGRSTPYDVEPATALTCEEFHRDLERGRVLGVVSLATDRHLVARALAGHPVPVVYEGEMDVHGRHVVDYPAMARLAARHLAQHGCRRIALIEHGLVHAESPLRDAFTAELQQHGLALAPGWHAGTLVARHHQGGLGALRQVWQAHAAKPDGLAVLDDQAYRELCPALLHNRIRVPDDLRIVSHQVQGDPQPFVPAPVGITVDPLASARLAADVLLSHLGVPTAPLTSAPTCQLTEPSPAIELSLAD